MVDKIGERIRDLRRKRGITQQDMAKALGVTPQAISRWEVGNGFPDIQLLPDIATLLDVTTDQLLGMDPDGLRSACLRQKD